MAKAKITHTIRNIAEQVLDQHPEGLRYSELTKQILAIDKTLNAHTVGTQASYLADQQPEVFYKPSRGLFRLTKFRQDEGGELKDELLPQPQASHREVDFYQPFADWLVNEMEDCTKAITFGGRGFKDKWGTPDVIGKRASKPSDIIQAPVEIVSAEIKPDVYQLVVAFGQACAYCLFSHKVYLVVSNKSPDDEIARLDALCQVFGLGLVLFNSDDPANPDFTIRCRPQRQTPDLFYANRYMKLVEKELFE